VKHQTFDEIPKPTCGVPHLRIYRHGDLYFEEFETGWGSNVADEGDAERCSFCGLQAQVALEGFVAWFARVFKEAELRKTWVLDGL
jgi:hypothetical protein